MPGVMRIPEKYLAREIERIANAGIRSVMTFGISHHTDATGSDTWNENGLVARMSRICKSTVPEMIVMSDTCFCEYTSHGHCGVLCDLSLIHILFVLICCWAGAQMLSMLIHAPGVFERLMQAQDASRPQVDISLAVGTLFGLIPFLVSCAFIGLLAIIVRWRRRR